VQRTPASYQKTPNLEIAPHPGTFNLLFAEYHIIKIFVSPDCTFKEVPVRQQQVDQVTESGRVSSQRF